MIIQQGMAKTAEANKNIEDAKLKIIDEQTKIQKYQIYKNKSHKKLINN